MKWGCSLGKAGLCAFSVAFASDRGSAADDRPEGAVAACVGRVTTQAEQPLVCHPVWYHLPFCSGKQNVVSTHNTADIRHGIWSVNGEFLLSLCLAL